MNWRVKGITQRVLSSVPGGVRLNDVLQRTVGGRRDFEGHVAAKVDDWSTQASYLQHLGVWPRGLRLMEIGTGWMPTLPLCHALCGAASCVTFDLVRRVKRGLTLQLLDAIRFRLNSIAERGGRPAAEVETAFADLRRTTTLAELLEEAKISYRAPADATRSGLASESVDVVFSNSVMEHVPRATIGQLMKESRRVLRPGGLAVHTVNCGDHYAYFDRGITPIHYLRFSEREWRFWNNELQYQNRLRPQDFIDLAEKAGLEVVLQRQKPREQLLAQLPRLPIAAEFEKYPPEQLCCTSIDFVVRKT